MTGELYLADDEMLLHSEVLEGADFSNRRLRYISVANGSKLTRCNFRRTRIDSGSWGGGYEPSEYVECVFDGCRLSNMFGMRGRFVRCSFRDVKIKAFHGSETEFVDCVFSGSLKAVIFNGTPLSMEKLGRSRNEFSGNDFTGATLRDVSFRGGIDLDQQRLPADPAYLIIRNAPEALDRVRKQVDQWPEAELRDDADSPLAVLESNVVTGQEDLFIERSFLGRKAETVERLSALLA